MVRLIPRDEKFFDLFVRDAENLLEAARKLEAMVASYDRLEERVAEIQALEKRGDQIDAEFAVRLERSFVTPFDREDIHELVVYLDDVVDGIRPRPRRSSSTASTTRPTRRARWWASCPRRRSSCSRRSRCSSTARHLDAPVDGA
jgi:hypothetical protein